MLLSPSELDILLRQLPQRLGDVTERRNKRGTVSCHAQETSNFWHGLWRTHVVDSSNLVRVWRDSILGENKSKEGQRRLVETHILTCSGSS